MEEHRKADVSRTGFIEQKSENEEVKEEDSNLLTIDEIFMLSFVTTMSPIYVFEQLSSSATFGCATYYVVYCLGILIIAVPLVALQLFLGDYTKCSFIKFWNIMPAFRGVGYIIAIMTTLDNTRLVGEIYPSIIMIYSVVQLRWYNCDFASRSEKCIKLSGNYPNMTCDCKDDNCGLRIGPLDWIYSTFPQGLNIAEETYSLTTSFAIVAVLVWLLVYVLATVDLKKLMVGYRILFTVGTIFVVIPSICFGTLYVNINDFKKPTFYNNKKLDSSQSLLLFLQGVYASTYHEKPGIYLYIGCMSQNKVKPISISTLLHIAKLISIASIYLIIFSVADIFKNGFRLQDENCINHSPFEIFFGQIPTVMAWTSLNRLFLFVWFIWIFFWYLPYAVVNMKCVVFSLNQMDLVAHQYRYIVPIFYGFSCFVICLFQTRYRESLIVGIYHYTVRGTSGFLMNCLFAIALLRYSLESITIDYKFQYGLINITVWVTRLKVALVTNIFAFIVNYCSLFFGKREYYEIKKNRNILRTLEIIFSFPLVLGVIFEYVKHKSLKTILKPLPSWGTAKEKERAKRLSFNPHRWTRYDNDTGKLMCTHHCLVFSPAWHEEVEYMSYRLNQFRKIFSQYIRETASISEEDL